MAQKPKDEVTYVTLKCNMCGKKSNKPDEIEMHWPAKLILCANCKLKWEVEHGGDE